MSRHDYVLTDQAREAVNGNFKQIAEEMGVAPQYIYGIIYGDNPDPYSYFRVFYAAVVRAGADYTVFDNDLAEIRARYRTLTQAAPVDNGFIIRKVQTDADTTAEIIKAFEDGKIDDTPKMIRIEQL